MLDVRSEIFRLRQQDPPLSYARIAATLGITKSRVQRELQKTARETSPKRSMEASGVDGGGNGAAAVPSWHPGVDAVVAQDPDLVERRKALERSRLELQELQLEAQRAEAQRRIAVLKASATVGGGESAGALANIAALLISELGGIRTDLSQAVATIGARVVQQQATMAPPAPPPPSLSDRLKEFRETASLVNAYAPQRPPSSRDELEFKAMMERLGMEERRITRQWEADLEERRERAAGQRARDEAIAKAIEGTAPLLQAAADRWLTSPNDASRSAPPARPHVIEGGQAGRSDPALLPGETRVTCPRCETEFAMTPGGSDDKCPGCGLEIALQDGKAVPRGANGSSGRRAEPPRFAS